MDKIPIDYIVIDTLIRESERYRIMCEYIKELQNNQPELYLENIDMLKKLFFK